MSVTAAISWNCLTENVTRQIIQAVDVVSIMKSKKDLCLAAADAIHRCHEVVVNVEETKIKVTIAEAVLRLSNVRTRSGSIGTAGKLTSSWVIRSWLSFCEFEVIGRTVRTVSVASI